MKKSINQLIVYLNGGCCFKFRKMFPPLYLSSDKLENYSLASFWQLSNMMLKENCAVFLSIVDAVPIQL